MLRIRVLLENEEVVKHRHKVETLCDTLLDHPEPGDALHCDWTVNFWASDDALPKMRAFLNLIRATGCKVEYSEVGLRDHVYIVRKVVSLAKQIEVACEIQKLKCRWFFPRLRARLRLWRNS